MLANHITELQSQIETKKNLISQFLSFTKDKEIEIVDVDEGENYTFVGRHGKVNFFLSKLVNK